MQKIKPSSQKLCKISGNGLTDLGHMAHTTYKMDWTLLLERGAVVAQ